jgi:hypothetical protein
VPGTLGLPLSLRIVAGVAERFVTSGILISVRGACLPCAVQIHIV